MNERDYFVKKNFFNFIFFSLYYIVINISI